MLIPVTLSMEATLYFYKRSSPTLPDQFSVVAYVLILEEFE